MRGRRVTTLGRVALYLVFALAVYAAVAGGRGRPAARPAPHAQRRATPSPPRSPRRWWRSWRSSTPSSRTTSRSAVVAEHTSRRAARTGYTLTSLWASQAGSLLLWLTVLTGAVGARAAPEPAPQPRADAVGRGRARRDRRLLRRPGGVRLVAVRPRRGRRAGRRRRARPVAPEPVHGGAPADALPGLRVDVRSRSRSRWRRSSPAASDARWLVSVRRWTLVSLDGARHRRCCSARTGPTSRSAGAATGRGIRSRTPRSCRGWRRRRSCTR